MPELISKTGLFIRMFFFRRAVHTAQKLFTVSEFSKSRLIHYFGEKKPVIVTYSALQSNFLEPGLKTIKKDKTILFIGNIKKHKGLFILLNAFLRAHKEGLDYKLIIVGSKDNIRTKDNEILNQLKNIDSSIVDFTGFISDIELKNLLSKSGLLVQPSLYEGFCLPPLEAMASGTKALISDIPVLKEVYSEYPVVFFQSGNALDLKSKMMELLYKKNPESILLPKKLLEKYNFAKTASIILKELTGKAS
jgi:glycosyltransferase involved in cell wall biosynthesis